MRLGDALLFDEMLPHQAEKCLVSRNVLAVRLVLGKYSLDKDLINQVIERYKTVPGENLFAMEYLENLLKYEEYKLPDSLERAQSDSLKETMPIAVDTKPNPWQKIKSRIKSKILK